MDEGASYIEGYSDATVEIRDRAHEPKVVGAGKDG